MNETPELKPLFDPATWDQTCADVTRAMLPFVARFATPVLASHAGGDDHWGTAAYFERPNGNLLLTNEHVLWRVQQDTLAHLLRDCDPPANNRAFLNGLIPITAPFEMTAFPVDAAIARVQTPTWNSVRHCSLAVPDALVAAAHRPVAYEILFCYGFAGQDCPTAFGEVVSRGTGYLCQETPPEMLDESELRGMEFSRLTTSQHFAPDHHFTVEYRPDRATTAAGGRSLPLPPGLSGSLVWNTRFVEATLKNVQWSPSLARVTGLVWGWHSSAARLVATRVEHVRDFVAAKEGAV